MSDLDYYKVLSILSPMISALLVGILTYNFTIKAKKFDILYQNKIPAFKAVVSELVSFRKYCWGRAAYFSGNEFSPYYNESPGALEHRTLISEVYELNTMFLSKGCRKEIKELISDMSGICNAETIEESDGTLKGIENSYSNLASKVGEIIDLMYKELNIN